MKNLLLYVGMFLLLSGSVSADLNLQPGKWLIVTKAEYGPSSYDLDFCAAVAASSALTDGKPEDYDDYKGEYAVEDTRHALVEARAAGIHPFCITIDRSAHDYMDHMFGEKNYIMIDDVKKLPRKMPEIYRVLTT